MRWRSQNGSEGGYAAIPTTWPSSLRPSAPRPFTAAASAAAERSSPTARSSRPDTKGMAITVAAKAAGLRSGGVSRTPSQQRTAVASRTVPRASAVGGIAARSAEVSEIGAGIQTVSDTSSRPSTAASATYVFQATAGPARAQARAAASATAGITGSRYCGNLDWLSEKKASGASTQQASSSGSRAPGFTPPASQAQRQRPPPNPARPRTHQGEAATGRVGRENHSGAARRELRAA